MAFAYSSVWLERVKLQSLLNAGLFYSLIDRSTGAVVSNHYTMRGAKRAQTRKTRVIRTRHLINQIGDHNGKN